jgi:hypothetical protein
LRRSGTSWGRRARLTPDARARVSRTLAATLAGRIGGIEPGSMPAERLLETVVAAKAAGTGGPIPPSRDEHEAFEI